MLEEPVVLAAHGDLPQEFRGDYKLISDLPKAATSAIVYPMILRLSDLTPLQRRMLARLDDGFEHQDNMGLEVEDLAGQDHWTVGSLIDKGLVEMVPGHKLQFWFRLTEAGRRVRETGVA